MTNTKDLAFEAAKNLAAGSKAASPEAFEKIMLAAFDAFDAFLAAEGTAEEFFQAMYDTGAAEGDRDFVISLLPSMSALLKEAGEELKENGVSDEAIERLYKFADDFDTLFKDFE